jgi:hypothetical protein
MPTQIFHTTDPAANERAAHAAWLQDHTQTVLYDATERYAVGHRGAMEEDLDRFMAPESWEWFEVEHEFYDPAYLQPDA